MEKLKNWHVFDHTDFDGVTVDAAKWEENLYSLAFNFFCTKENENEEQVGFTLCTMVYASCLAECHERILEILNTGFFDEIEVSSHGTLYDKEGDEIEEICWNNYADDDEEGEGVEEDNRNELKSDDIFDKDIIVPKILH